MSNFYRQLLIYSSEVCVRFALLAEELVQHEPLKEWHCAANAFRACKRKILQLVKVSEEEIWAYRPTNDLDFGQRFLKNVQHFFIRASHQESLRSVCNCVYVRVLSTRSYCFCRLGVHPAVNDASCFSTDTKSVLRVCDWYACVGKESGEAGRGRVLRSRRDFS